MPWILGYQIESVKVRLQQCNMEMQLNISDGRDMQITLHYKFNLTRENSKKFYSKAILIGRPFKKVPDLDLTPDERVSRLHARLEYNLGTWWVEDLNSTNGTSLNGERITNRTELVSGDHLKIGDTEIRVEFLSSDNSISPGIIVTKYQVDETQPSEKISEDLRLKIFSHIAQITSRLQGQSMLEAFLDELLIAFPSAEAWTIALIEDREIVHRAYKPRPSSSMSNYLARKVVYSQESFLWTRSVDLNPGESHISSLFNVTSAIYAPIVFCKNTIGVIFVGSTSLQDIFTKDDLLRLSEIANIIAPSIKASQSETFDRLYNVFVSYSKSDRKWVERLAGNLRRRSIKVFFDERILPGSDRSKQIKRTIQSVDAFLLACSTNNDRIELIAELDLAKKFNKYIIPIQMDTAAVPDTISNVEVVNFSESEYNSSIQKLAQTITSLPKYENTREEYKVKILFLAANPFETPQLRLDQEAREIDRRLRSAEYRDRFELKTHWAVRHSDIAELLLRYQPQIVHFSGHGSKKGEIILENESGEAHAVSSKVFGKLFHVLNDNVKCVILNACYSAKQAEAISNEIGCVIGMSKSMGDDASITFSAGFYQALGYGRNVQDAFDLGCVEIGLPGNHRESEKPKLYTRAGVQASDIVFE